MKKTIILIAILFAWVSQAQISQGNSLINAHIGFGLTTQASANTGGAYGVNASLKTKVPPIGVSYEYAVQDNITVGAFGAYSSQQYVLSASGYSVTTDYSYMFFGGLANYHFGFIESDSFDVYAGLRLGYLSFSTDTSTHDSNNNYYSNLNGTADISGMVFGGQVGARYFFSDNLAAHLMLGYGVSYFNLGLTYKL